VHREEREEQLSECCRETLAPFASFAVRIRSRGLANSPLRVFAVKLLLFLLLLSLLDEVVPMLAQELERH